MTGHRGTGEIVVGVDGSPGSQTALAWALAEARWHGCAVRVVVGIGSGTSEPVWGCGADELADQASHMLHRTVTEAIEAGPADRPVPVAEQVVDQPAAQALLTVGSDARMIVVGARGRGLLHRLRVGSVSRSVAVHAPVPVVIARGGIARGGDDGAGLGFDRQPRPVVVGVDGSPNSLAALVWAAAEADQRGVELIAVHAWLAALPVPFAEAPVDITQALGDQAGAVLERAITAVRDALPAGLEPQRRILPCSPSQALLATGQDGDLVVVGARGHGGFAELLLGSVSHQCMIHSTVPVAIIRSC
ncbi:Universal stress protein UspA-like protein [Frankia sp. AiPs1]|uniref:universal stress protein n=1 Tax=Frankia sp. AiPa1 TaxID=573492 RepID=UPI00202AC8CD|nr:universal stress protein [Frankia sp. AiPa1]MCL9759027.1 universal stress protein [Frankia sp. AiPa1]